MRRKDSSPKISQNYKDANDETNIFGGRWRLFISMKGELHKRKEIIMKERIAETESGRGTRDQRQSIFLETDRIGDPTRRDLVASKKKITRSLAR